MHAANERASSPRLLQEFPDSSVALKNFPVTFPCKSSFSDSTIFLTISSPTFFIIAMCKTFSPVKGSAAYSAIRTSCEDMSHISRKKLVSCSDGSLKRSAMCSGVSPNGPRSSGFQTSGLSCTYLQLAFPSTVLNLLAACHIVLGLFRKLIRSVVFLVQSSLIFSSAFFRRRAEFTSQTKLTKTDRFSKKSRLCEDILHIPAFAYSLIDTEFLRPCIFAYFIFFLSKVTFFLDSMPVFNYFSLYKHLSKLDFRV